jgi:hypothetical protein
MRVNLSVANHSVSVIFGELSRKEREDLPLFPSSNAFTSEIVLCDEHREVKICEFFMRNSDGKWLMQFFISRDVSIIIKMKSIWSRARLMIATSEHKTQRNNHAASTIEKLSILKSIYRSLQS